MEMKLCDECKSNEANIHLTQIMQNEIVVQHLCEECAKRKGVSIVIDEKQVQATTDNASGKLKETCKSSEPVVRCLSCGTSFDDFKEKGWLGCSNCYTTFEKEIDALLVQVHGSKQHKGKMYHGTPGVCFENDISFLRHELDSAICQEKFELAAMIRDKINTIVSSNSPQQDRK